MLLKIFHTKLMIPSRDKDLSAVQHELDHLMPFHILPPSGNYIWGLELHCKILLTRKKNISAWLYNDIGKQLCLWTLEDAVSLLDLHLRWC